MVANMQKLGRGKQEHRVFGRAISFALLATGVMLAGCASQNRHSVNVGAVPQDYRTAHPIIIGEHEVTYDVPVGAGIRALPYSERQSILGFMSNYNKGTSVRIIVPRGSPNQPAAQGMARKIIQLLTKNGVNAGSISTFSYKAAANNNSAPVRIAYDRVMAKTKPCGRWGADLSNTSENRNWQNFGCSSQNNLAAQIANPADLMGPRKQGVRDQTQRGTVMERYRTTFGSLTNETDYTWTN